MNEILTGILIGLGAGVVVFPIGLGIYKLFKNTIMRRKIKRMIRKGNFLIPIDPKDYNVSAWKDQKYGNIKPEDYEKDLKNLNFKIFKKLDDDKKMEVSDDFIKKAVNYIKKAKEMGYDDNFIKSEFRKKNYTEEVIKKIYEMPNVQ